MAAPAPIRLSIRRREISFGRSRSMLGPPLSLSLDMASLPPALEKRIVHGPYLFYVSGPGTA